MTTSASVFQNCKLINSARSPFGRRVKIALIERGIEFEETLVNVFETGPSLWERNPLRKVPVVELKSGQVIVDSFVILAILEKENDQTLSLTDSITHAHWSGLAVALAERTVEFFIETRRRPEMQDPEILAEFPQMVKPMLARLEKDLTDHSAFWNLPLNQTQIAWGSALSYLKLRAKLPLADWMSRYPLVATFLQKVESRPSFQATRPPT